MKLDLLNVRHNWGNGVLSQKTILAKNWKVAFTANPIAVQTCG